MGFINPRMGPGRRVERPGGRGGPSRPPPRGGNGGARVGPGERGRGDDGDRNYTPGARIRRGRSRSGSRPRPACGGDRPGVHSRPRGILPGARRRVPRHARADPGLPVQPRRRPATRGRTTGGILRAGARPLLPAGTPADIPSSGSCAPARRRAAPGIRVPPRPAPYVHRWATPRPSTSRAEGVSVRTATLEQLDDVVAFWTDGPYREELRRSLHVLWSRPNPGERVVPFLAERDGDPVGSAVLFEQSPVASLHGVGTVPGDRSRGIASSLVAAALDALDPGTVGAVVLATDSPRAAGRLDELGFTTLSEFVEYRAAPRRPPRDARPWARAAAPLAAAPRPGRCVDAVGVGPTEPRASTRYSNTSATASGTPSVVSIPTGRRERRYDRR